MSINQLLNETESDADRVRLVEGPRFSRLASKIVRVLSDLSSHMKAEYLLITFGVLAVISFGSAGWYTGASYGRHQQRLSVNC
jgi:hypothetical protein